MLSPEMLRRLTVATPLLGSARAKKPTFRRVGSRAESSDKSSDKSCAALTLSSNDPWDDSFNESGDESCATEEPSDEPEHVVLSSDQLAVFDGVQRWLGGRKLPGQRDPQVLRVGGFAGTGKSTVVAELARTLGHRKVAFATYTGKASNVLHQKLRAAGATSDNHTCGTIHQLIYIPVVHSETGVVTSWGKRKELEVDLIVVDEASMINDRILRDLRSFDVPILAVGDHGQLPPIEGESVLTDDPELRLERIHRQAEDSPIIRLSRDIREQGDLPGDFDYGGAVQIVNEDLALDLLHELYAERADVGIVAYTNRSRQRFNHMARLLVHDGEVPGKPTAGDQVICLRNADATIFNGQRGVVLDDWLDVGQWFEGAVAFPEDELEVQGSFLKSQFGRERTYASWEEVEQDNKGLKVRGWEQAGLLFDYGYCMTGHKVQGSQFNVVFVYCERLGRLTEDEWRRWIYTAVTRAVDQLYIVLP